MKRLRDTTPFAKTLEYITAMEFRKAPGEILDSVLYGKTFVITKNGRPVAVVSRPPGQQLAIAVDSKGIVTYGLES